MPREHELNGYLQRWCCTYEMKQDCLNIGFTGKLIPFGTYEDSNLPSDSGDAGKDVSLLWGPSILLEVASR
jgi:hypothetical protein